MGEPSTGHNSVAADQIKSIIERIERLEEEKKTIADDIRDVYAESKGNDLDVKALRTIVRLRKGDYAGLDWSRKWWDTVLRQGGAALLTLVFFNSIGVAAEIVQNEPFKRDVPVLPLDCESGAGAGWVSAGDLIENSRFCALVSEGKGICGAQHNEWRDYFAAKFRIANTRFDALSVGPISKYDLTKRIFPERARCIAIVSKDFGGKERLFLQGNRPDCDEQIDRWRIAGVFRNDLKWNDKPIAIPFQRTVDFCRYVDPGALRKLQGLFKGFVGLFERVPLQSSYNEKEEGKQRYERGEQRHWVFEFFPPSVGGYLFALGLLCGLAAVVVIFSAHQLLAFPLFGTAAALILVGLYSTSLNRPSENVRVKAVIIAELELSNVQRHVFFADLMEGAHHTALHDRPEAFNRIGVDRTDDVFMRGMADNAMREAIAEIAVAGMFISANKAYPIGHGLMHETVKRCGIGAVDHASDHIALAANRPDDGGFARTKSASAASALVPMLVVPLATKEAFVNFNDATELSFGLNQSGADFVAHGMSRAIAPEPHDALNLKGANPLLAGQHQMGDAKPLAERLIRVFKDRARDVREAVARIRRALVALPFERHRANRKDFRVAAAGAFDAIRPAARDQISFAGFFIRERRFKLSDGHLVNWARSTGHVASPVYGGQYGMEI